MKILLVALWLLCIVSAAHAEEFNAKVIAVMDGDTVLALRGAQKVKIRLANIDAPEKGQDFGSESRQALLNRVLKKQVRVNNRAIDDYGRVVAELSVDGRSVNEDQVRDGMAWNYSYFHSDKSSSLCRVKRKWRGAAYGCKPAQRRRGNGAKPMRQ